MLNLVSSVFFTVQSQADLAADCVRLDAVMLCRKIPDSDVHVVEVGVPHI